MIWLSKKWSNYLHYVGLAFALFMVFEARRDSLQTDATLEALPRQQSNLRDLLWINLLLQRSANLAYTAYQSKDPGGLERAGNIADSVQPYLESIRANRGAAGPRELDEQTAHAVAEFQVLIHGMEEKGVRSVEMPTLLKSLSAMLDASGQRLNEAESNEWYALREHNQALVKDLEADHAMLVRLLALFVVYLLFVGWVNRQKERIEAALRESEGKLVNVAKMSALGEMAGGVAHEINNPLATISLKAQQARELLAEGGDPRQAMDMIDVVSRTTARIAAIVQGLRTFSRDGSGDPFVSVKVAEIMENTLSLCQERFKHRGIELRVPEISPSLAVPCRSGQISQILLNLLGNACDAVTELPVRWVSLDVREEGNDVLISVTDSGEGIAPAARSRLFQPFFTTKPVGKGTGLGLSIAKGLAEAHGGSLAIDERSPKTRFVLRLPKKSPEERAA